MPVYTSYSKARANLAKLCDEAALNKEIVLITRRDGEDVALISASELASLIETTHLMRSPKNVQRLLAALNRALSRTENPSSVEDLKKEFGLDEKET